MGEVQAQQIAAVVTHAFILTIVDVLDVGWKWDGHRSPSPLLAGRWNLE